jgi:Fe-S cluster biosynthesis and repair protein YggX
MSDNKDRIAQFRKMATDDPDNELGHYRLGVELAKDGQHAEAVASFRRTLELSPQFSKVYQLLGQSLLAQGNAKAAADAWRQGFTVADERGDFNPRDEMERLLKESGEPVPERKQTTTVPLGLPEVGGVGGFRCQRPTCMSGARARQLPAAPFKGELGERIHATVCADCWNDWLKNYSVKVINELRLDLSTDHGEAEYDRYMREFLGIE